MPNQTYTTNIPLATDDPSVSQGQLNTNCTSVANLLNTDMIGFNDNNGGYHYKTTYVDQSSSPPTGVAGADVVYGSLTSGVIELFVQRPTGSPIQLTRGNVSATGSSFGGGSSSGYTFLPGGILIQWGAFDCASSATSFSFALPFTNLFTITGSIQSATTQSFCFLNMSVSGGQARQSAGAAQRLNYIAIGN